jgi:6-phosphogluconolactonase (cycloisomerase 2 family)
VDGLDGARGVAVSPDGAHVYVTGRIDDAVATFARDPATGALSFVELDKDGMGGVDGLDDASLAAASPDGAHLYVAGQLDDAVATFAREGAPRWRRPRASPLTSSASARLRRARERARRSSR